jgi:hypothetical protein
MAALLREGMKRMTELKYRQPVWWGTFDFVAGQCRQWHLAGLDLGIVRVGRDSYENGPNLG